MKKRTLLSLMMVVSFVIGAVAQTDITPSRYVFANQPVGEYNLDATNAGANPPIDWALPKQSFNNGFVVLAGAPPHITSLEAPQVKGFQAGMSIVDLGGEVGKVLCIQGEKSNYKIGTPMTSEYKGAWCNLNLYLDPKNTPNLDDNLNNPANATIRVRMVFSIADNAPSLSESALSRFFTSSNQNVASPELANVPTNAYPSDLFLKLDEYDDPTDEYDPTKWMIHEMDVTVKDKIGVPTRLKIELLNTRVPTSTILIKEIKFTVQPTGEPIKKQTVHYAIGTESGLFTPKTREALDLFVSGNNVTVQNLAANSAIHVYNMVGQSVKMINTGASSCTFDLSKGMYIVKAGEKTGKIIVK